MRSICVIMLLCLSGCAVGSSALMGAGNALQRGSDSTNCTDWGNGNITCTQNGRQQQCYRYGNQIQCH